MVLYPTDTDPACRDFMDVAPPDHRNLTATAAYEPDRPAGFSGGSSMAISLPLLDSIQVASPCTVRWDHMTPVGAGDRLRHCAQCSLNVHNISDMTRDDAEAFLRAMVPGQRVCGTFWRRPDGTILTRDCPVGLRAARQRLIRVLTRAAAAAALLLSGFTLARSRAREERWATGLGHAQPFATLIHWVRGRPAPTFIQTGGLIAVPTPPVPVTGTPQGGGS